MAVVRGRVSVLDIIGGFLAAGGAISFVTAIYMLNKWEWSFVSLVSLNVFSATFGGFFISALRDRDRVRNAIVAGFAFAAMMALGFVLYNWRSQNEVERELSYLRMQRQFLSSVSLNPYAAIESEEVTAAEKEIDEEIARIESFSAEYFKFAIPFCFLTIISFPLGAICYQAAERLSVLSNPRRRWTYMTDDRKSIDAYSPWQHRAIGFLWRALSWLAFLGAWAPIVSNLSDKTVSFAAALIGMVWGVFGFVAMGIACRAIAMRSLAVSADVLLSKDPRAPIVYLRSFADDGRSLEDNFLRTLFTGPRQITKPTLEARLSKAMNKLGPFVGIGRPQEIMPALGAARMYVSDNDWQLVVDDLIRKAQLVVLQAGASRGLRWEFEHVCKTVPPEKVVLFVPIELAGKRSQRREIKYKLFREWASEVFPRGLPEVIGDTFFIAFKRTPEWEPALIRPKSILEGHPNHAVLSQLANDRVFIRKREIGCLQSILILVVVTALFVVIGSWIVHRMWGY